MQPSGAGPGPTYFSQPIRAISTMIVVCLLVGAGLWYIHGRIGDILLINPALNGLIAFVFLFGVGTCFWQVAILAQSVSWIERFVRRDASADEAAAPRLLAPLAALLRSRGERSTSISASSGRTILDSVAQRVDEARDITRYLINLLVFLGLLGTFWGLATTVPAVVETIRGLAPAEGEAGTSVFARLMSGLESQLGGMGTAFSSSLLGLGGSLVLGLLELFAGHGQNRFYRELEEWLSSITRIGLSDGDGGASDQSAIVQVLDAMASQMERMQELFIDAQAGRGQSDAQVAALAGAVTRLGERLIEAQAAEAETRGAILKVAEAQDRLVAAMDHSREESDGLEAENRMRLRSIDVQLLRVLEELSAGRQETTADLRSDLAALTGAVRQLSRTGLPPQKG